MFGKNKVAMVVAEFLGTGVLALVFLSVQRSTIGIPYFVAMAAGLAIAALMYVFSSVSGGHFNPAVTLGLLVARKVKVVPAVVYVIAQLLGGWAAYGLYTYFVNSSLQKLGGDFSWRVFLAEAVGAFIFAFIWSAVVARRYAVAVAGVGFALGVIVAAAASIGIINPAIAIAARAWEPLQATGWLTYALGPVVGGIVGVNLYYLLFAGRDAAGTGASSEARTTAAGSARAVRSVTAEKAAVEKMAETHPVAPAKRKTATARKTTTSRKRK